MKKYLFLYLIAVVIFLFSFTKLIAEPEKNLVPADSTKEFTVRNATKAILYSAFIPGGGQVYNKEYVKAGVAFGLELTFLGSGIYYQVQREKAWDDYTQSDSQQDYDRYNDFHLKSQSMYWWFFAVKFLSVVDAYVDAKLFNYDKKKRQLELELGSSSISLNYKF